MNPSVRTMKRNHPAVSLALTVMTVMLLAGCQTAPRHKETKEK